MPASSQKRWPGQRSRWVRFVLSLGNAAKCPVRVRLGHSAKSAQCPGYPGGFNWSAQHLLILLDEEVANGDVTDIVHGEAEGRTLGALEERTKCVGHLPGAGKEEQDRRPADRGSQWRDRSGAASQSCGGVEA